MLPLWELNLSLVCSVAERRGISVRGTIPSVNAILHDIEDTDVYASLLFPSFTAAAFYHKKLAPDLLNDVSTESAIAICS